MKRAGWVRNWNVSSVIRKITKKGMLMVFAIAMMGVMGAAGVLNYCTANTGHFLTMVRSWVL